MSFPTITFKHSHTDEGRQLEAVVVHKFAALAKYIGEETDVRCEVEFLKEAGNQSGLIYRTEANVWVAGTLFRAEATEETFEKAIDSVRDDLDAEMHKVHDKRVALARAGAREAKQLLQQAPDL